MKIPTGNFGNVAQQIQPTRVGIGNVDAQSQALQHLATVGINVAGQQQQRIDQDNQSQLQALTIQLDDFNNTLINDPNHGLLSRQGTNAEGATQEYLKKYEDYANSLTSEVPEGLREQFKVQAQARHVQLSRTGLTFEGSQRRQVEEGNFNATVANSQTRAESYWNDNVSYQLEVGSTKHQIAEYGRAHGWTDEQVQQKQESFINTAAYNTSRNAMVSDPAGFQRLAGEPSNVEGATRYSGGKSTEPLGIRSNNPGNLERTDNAWDGEVNGSGRFAEFATPEHGLRALCKNLLAYNKRGYSTVAQIVNRWAPPGKDGKENDTAGYTTALSKSLGVDADQPLDLTNINTLVALCNGITQQENGSNPYSKEQITNGALAALGMAELPQPEGVKLRSVSTTAFAQLDPTQRAQLRDMAEGQLNKQQAEYRTQLGTSIDDAHAAFERGDIPEVIPSESQLIQGYGYSEGKSKSQDLQEAKRYAGYISAAKQMTPSAQSELSAQIKPNPNDVGYERKIQRWDRFNRFVAQNVIAQEKQQAVTRFDSSLKNNFQLDPTDKNNQAAADNYFDSRIAPKFDINDEQSLNSVATITARSGIIPSQVKTMLNAGAMSNDPNMVVPLAKMYGQIFDNNPSAAVGIDPSTMAYFKKVYDFNRSGVPADKAVDMAYNLVYQQDERTKQMIGKKISDKDYIKDRDSAAQNNITSITAATSFTPSTADPSRSNFQYQRDYNTLYDANFALTGGDDRQAAAITNAQIKTQWGVSRVNGSPEIMRYSPEAVYGVSNGVGNWLAGQWEKEKAQLKTISFGGTREDTELNLIPDALTPRDFSYAVMVMQANADGIVEPRPYLGPNGMPLRFKPDQQSSPMYQQVMRSSSDKVQQAKEARSGESQTSAQPIDMTKPFGFGSADTLPPNITGTQP
ncbi:Uncharacterised protein [Yersinia aldovae]|uniref:hypothetical protein n=1 Tax=Yersinia aldovae TaxID=29483 RepID=UPI0005DE14CE|nr:hypothetical protein [Yersinia aldovae]CNK10330.1 Uncharacterised protein [Yersinia aldovae]